jgi:hypothetical protein
VVSIPKLGPVWLSTLVGSDVCRDSAVGHACDRQVSFRNCLRQYHELSSLQVAKDSRGWLGAFPSCPRCGPRSFQPPLEGSEFSN